MLGRADLVNSGRFKLNITSKIYRHVNVIAPPEFNNLVSLAFEQSRPPTVPRLPQRSAPTPA